MVNDQDQPGLFFARQVINNACGTQALLSVLLNIKDEKTQLGETLANFVDFAGCLDSEMKGKIFYCRGVGIRLLRFLGTNSTSRTNSNRTYRNKK